MKRKLCHLHKVFFSCVYRAHVVNIETCIIGSSGGADVRLESNIIQRDSPYLIIDTGVLLSIKKFLIKMYNFVIYAVISAYIT